MAPQRCFPPVNRDATLLPFDFNWSKPDYARVFEHRAKMLQQLRQHPKGPLALAPYYKEHPAQFINDWGMTFDPRNVAKGIPTVVPFILFARQIEWIEWAMARWRAGERGLTEKSRECGVSWLLMSLFSTLCLFNEGFVAGCGSRKAEYVDKPGNPKTLLWKARFFLNNLPEEYRGGWIEEEHARDMRIRFPQSGSFITGEGGDDIGRGDRTSIYGVDEAAFLEHPELAESSLSSTTDCRHDVSTPSGPGGAFAERRRSLLPRQVFTFHYRDDPRKSPEWEAKKRSEVTAATFAREHQISYAESLDHIVIPMEWVEAAIGAAAKLGIEPSGARTGGLDVMDQGHDLNVFVGRHGISVNVCKSWVGKGIDIHATTVEAFEICAQHRIASFIYDAVGVGAGVRGDARVINEQRRANEYEDISADPFFGSGQVFEPDDILDTDRQSDRLNRDYYANLKAQCWWWLRLKFEHTWRALNGKPYDEDKLISIDLPPGDELTQLTLEIAQPTYGLTSTGKLLVNKTPEGARSPNHADALVICMAPITRWMDTWMKLAG